MSDWIVESELGQRVWQADDIDHALEQHRDAFPDERITGAWLDSPDSDVIE